MPTELLTNMKRNLDKECKDFARRMQLRADMYTEEPRLRVATALSVDNEMLYIFRPKLAYDHKITDPTQ